MRLTTRDRDVDGIHALLDEPRFELMPFDSFDEQVTHLPDGATVTITTSPTLGLDATLEKTEVGANADYEIVPHIAARYVEDEAHLEEIVDRFAAVGITDIFVPGGDREEPIGEYTSAHELLVDLEAIDHPFENVGITGYPEGHAFLSDETLWESMQRKEPHATYIVTQLCYDAATVVDWVEDVRDHDVDLPISVGLPGVMKYQRLLRISRKVGVGDSVRFLRKTSGILGFVRQLVGSRGTYTPDDLVDGLAPYATDPEYDLMPAHIYTFNQVPDTEDWRHDRLDSDTG